ncbi:MAG: hypothetical protein M3Y27_22080 [Acidobacteriota bacterium]|nr:hypothetical protein [Acidobacteriota bacterium]
MTLTIDANVVWKPRNILRVVAAKVDDHQKFKILKTVMMRVLTAFPEACAAVVTAIEELGGEPWQLFPHVGT